MHACKFPSHCRLPNAEENVIPLRLRRFLRPRDQHDVSTDANQAISQASYNLLASLTGNRRGEGNCASNFLFSICLFTEGLPPKRGSRRKVKPV